MLGGGSGGTGGATRKKLAAAAGGEGSGITAEARSRFDGARMRTFLGMLFGYATYYCTRLSFSFVAPAMRREMGLSMLQIGTISSIFPLAYMNSKFIAGVLADMLGSPAIIFALGMSLTGLANIGLTMGNSVPWFTFFWVANGLFQGCGAGPCGKMLVTWFPAVSRGKWWSGWNASGNIGGFCIPLLAGTVAAQYGWRWGMRVPGMMAVVMGLLCVVVMRDSPEKMGLPSAEEFHTAGTSTAAAVPATEEAAGGGEAKAAVVVAAEEPDGEEEQETAMQVLLKNRFLWCMALMHFFVYLMRQGITNWSHFYIMDNFGTSAAQATACVSGFEFGGLLGCLSSGQLSDWLIKRNPSVGAAGLRARVMFAYALLSPLAACGLWCMPPSKTLQWLAMALFGFSVYGPQTLITMTGVETVPRKFAATVTGFLAYPAQLGAMVAGLPFALIVKRFGWRGYFPTLIFMSVLSALMVLPGWNAPSYAQRQAARRAKASASAA